MRTDPCFPELPGGGDGCSLTGLFAEAQELQHDGTVLAAGGLRQISLLEHLKPVGEPDGARDSGAGLGVHNAWRKDNVTLSFVWAMGQAQSSGTMGGAGRGLGAQVVGIVLATSAPYGLLSLRMVSQDRFCHLPMTSSQ